MNEEPKSIWKKSWKGPRGFLRWFSLLLVAAFAIIFSIGYASAIVHPGQLVFIAFLDAICLALAGALAIWFIRWLCCWKNFRRFLFGCACLATLIALFYAEEDWRGKHDWEKFKHKWEAKGEKFDWQSVVPPPVPDDQNFAMAPIWSKLIEVNAGTNSAEQLYGTNFVEQEPVKDADRLQMSVGDWENYSDWPTNGNWERSTLTDLTPWQNYYRTLAAKTNLFPVSPQPQTPAQTVLTALSKYDSTIEDLRQASQRPYSRFPLDYNRDDVWAILLPHLAPLKRCTQVLQLRAIAELQNGESDKALDDVKLMLRLQDSIRSEQFLISHLVRIAMVQITLQPIYEGLAEHQWSDAQLADLDSELAKLDFLADYELAMRGERGCQISAVEFLRHRNLRHFNEIFNMTGNGDHTQLSPAAVLFYLCPNGWFYQNELRVCRFYAKWYLPLVNETERTVSPADVRATDHAFDLEMRHRTPENFLEPWLLPELDAAVKRFAYAQESVDLARVAIALEHCHLAYGEYPKSLDALAPQFMEKIPHDIINGGPLHYRRTSDGQFILYSIGWDDRDDGGVVVYERGSKPSRVDINKGDWVWRYPQK